MDRTDDKPCKTCDNYPCNYVTASKCEDLIDWQKLQENRKEKGVFLEHAALAVF